MQAGDLAGTTVRIGDAVARRGNAFSLWLGAAVLKVGGWRLQGEIPDLPKMVLIGAPPCASCTEPRITPTLGSATMGQSSRASSREAAGICTTHVPGR